MSGKLLRLWRRFIDYSFVGVSTFLLDLGLLYLLTTYTAISESVAIGIAFGCAVSINFFISYYVVFRGTKRDRFTGYVYFLFVALVGMQLIIFGTQAIQDQFGMHIYAARIILSGIVGMANFAFNTFINFKMFR